MISRTVLAILAPALASAHYTFPGFIFNHNTTGDWEYVRETTNHYSHGPIQDVTDAQMLCYELSGRPASDVATVSAGDEIGFRVDPGIVHPGPGFVYMAKVPDGSDVTTWEPTDKVWFKIAETPPTVNASGLQWPLNTQSTSWNVTIPAETPSGDYLIRVEHIALHSAGTEGGAQFYLGCAQTTVSNGGSGTPGPLVAFPGAYSATDPGILINLYYPIPTNYTMPGPAMWPAGSTAEGSATGSSGNSSSADPPSSAAPVSSAAAASTSAAATTMATSVVTSSSADTGATTSAAAAAASSTTGGSSCKRRRV